MDSSFDQCGARRHLETGLSIDNSFRSGLYPAARVGSADLVVTTVLRAPRTCSVPTSWRLAAEAIDLFSGPSTSPVLLGTSVRVRAQHIAL